jgi:hypothetical protein
MKTASLARQLLHFGLATIFGVLFLIAFARSVGAQQPGSNSVEVQREAMHKLSFLAGQWSGPVTIFQGPGEVLHLNQTEDVQYKVDGLVLLVQGKSTGADGKEVFSALATISYDDASHSYRFRAYNNGHYLDTELSVDGKGFSWGFTAASAHIVNTMHLTNTGEWNEITEATFGNNPPHRSMDMLLQRRP